MDCGSKELKEKGLVWLEHKDEGGLWKEMWAVTGLVRSGSKGLLRRSLGFQLRAGTFSGERYEILICILEEFLQLPGKGWTGEAKWMQETNLRERCWELGRDGERWPSGRDNLEIEQMRLCVWLIDWCVCVWGGDREINHEQISYDCLSSNILWTSEMQQVWGDR